MCDARGGEAKYCSSELSSGSSQTYNNNNKKEATSSSSSSSSSCILRTTTTGESNVVDELDNKRKTSSTMFNNNNGPEFEYVSSILSRTGLSVKKAATTTTNIVSVSLFLHQWLSPPPTQQQPLDPSIFHHLEQLFQNQKQEVFSSVSSKYGDLGLRCNRRLLFDLVNETLMSEVVVGSYYYDVEEAVWERIGRFQSNKKCEVLEDIDALVEMEEDMGKKNKKKMKMKMKSAEEMVAEIEGNIMDTLLHETVRIVTECCCRWWWYGKDEDDDDSDDAVYRQRRGGRGGDMSRGWFT